MAKRKAKSDVDIFTDLAKQTGGSLASKIDPVNYYVDTGNLALNYVCSGRFFGGGIPGGRMTEIYGPSGSAKSLWGVTLLRGIQKLNGVAILLDCENSFNPEFASRAGHVSLSRLISYSPTSLERVFSKIYNVTRAIREKDKDIPILFVWDSLTVSGVERQMREIDLPEEYTQEKFKSIVGSNEQPGERAAVCSKEFRKLQAFMPEQNATLFIINQTRTKIGAYGDPTTTGGGGAAMEFYPHCRLQTLKAKTGGDLKDKETKRPLGVKIRIKNVKNRENTPFLQIPDRDSAGGIPLYFDRGIDPLGGLLSTLLMAGRIVPAAGAGFYQIAEPWANGQEIKFRSSLSRNDVDAQTLYDNPGLVDAASKMELEEYLADFSEAIQLSNSEGYEEVKGKTDEEEFLDNL